MCPYLSNSRDWIDVLKALLIPTLTLFGILIAYLQWKTNQDRLSNERFAKRFKQYKAARRFLQSCMVGSLNEEERLKFLHATAGSRFLFKNRIISIYLNEIHDKAVEFREIQDELKTCPDDRRASLSKNECDMRKWFSENLKTLEDRFSKYI